MSLGYHYTVVSHFIFSSYIMALRLTWLISTIFMIVMNTLAVMLPLNGITTKELSDTLSTLITPAGFTFAIWSLIYLSLIVLTLAIVLKKIHLPDRVMVLYILSALANGLWIVAWHYGNLHFSMIIIVWLLVSLIMIDRLLLRNRSSIAYFPRVRWTILFYLGRVQIATLLLTFIYAQYQLWITMWYESSIAMGILILAGAVNLLVICRERNIITSLVALRALWGIMKGQTDPQIILTTQIVMGILIAGILWNEGKKYMVTPQVEPIMPTSRI